MGKRPLVRRLYLEQPHLLKRKWKNLSQTRKQICFKQYWSAVDNATTASSVEVDRTDWHLAF
jgi:hypothetical protein